MKIGNRNITSLRDAIEQFQEFAITHPWLASADIVVVAVIILAVEVFSASN